MIIKSNLVKLFSSIGTPYLGFSIDENIDQYLIGIDQTYIDKKIKRDKGKNHVTLISPMDYEKRYDALINSVCELNFIGVGTATDGKSTTYFIGVESSDAQSILRMLKLPQKDLHLTIAFTKYDVHNVPKKAFQHTITP